MKIQGKESAFKAEFMATHLMLVFRNREDIKVNRHVKKARLIYTELDDAFTPPQSFTAVATAGGWNPGEITVGESQKRSPLSMETMWVWCPLVREGNLSL